MSDWNRTGRDNDQERYGAESRDRNRRDFGERDRWRADRERAGEARSFGERRGGFDERQPDPERGGYSGRSFGGPDFGAQNQGYGGQSYRGESEASRSYPSQDDWRRPQGGQDYGQERNRQGYGQSYGAQGSRGQAADLQRYGADQPRYGQDGDALGVNPVLRRQTEGETDHGWRANMGMGEHRGRGPKNYIRSDERIREDINDRLSDDSWLDASEIEVKVEKCEVTLTGTVQSREDKRRAEDLAEQVSGVKHVQNSLRVQPASSQNARDVTASAGGRPPPVT